MAKMSGLRFLHVCYEGRDVVGLSPVELLSLPYYNDIVNEKYTVLEPYSKRGPHDCV